jgi:gamma-glutamylcyclotransferase (GGCT)/AIG2-like uncharacterized protein YtfP
MPASRVFAYGTLLEPARQRKLFGRRVPFVAAALSGWKKARCVGRYYGIVRCPGAFTSGGVLHLTRSELKAADEWEQVPRLYVRRRLSVRAKDAPTALRCWTYMPTATALRSKAIRSAAFRSKADRSKADLATARRGVSFPA